MGDKVHRAYLWLFAGIALAAGCVLTATTLGRLAVLRGKMERRMAEYTSMSQLDARLRHMETALTTWQERAPGPPAPISVLATGVFSDVKIEVREVASSNAASGLVARRIEVTGQDAPFDRAMQLVQRLDGLWPRWVLVHLEIKSTDQMGKGRVMMRFESVSSAASTPAVVQSQTPDSPPAPTATPLVPADPPPAPPATPLVTGDPAQQRQPTGELPQVDGAATNKPPFRGWLVPSG